MKNLWASACLVVSVLCAAPVMADSTGAVVGGALGSAIGAAIGHDANGRHGAIVGAAIGGATGAAIGSNSDRNQGYTTNNRQERRGDYRDNRNNRGQVVVVKKVVYVHDPRDYRPHQVKQRVVYYKGHHRHHRHNHYD